MATRPQQLGLFSAAVEVREPLVVSDGLGVDSTAMLVGLRDRGIRPDAILFADVGTERPETYAFRAVRDSWLDAVGFPPLTVVRYEVQRPRRGGYATLEEECLLHGKLPAFSYGRRQCSAKWKCAPQQKWVRAWPLAQRAWEAGLTVQQAIGFDAGTSDRRRTLRVPPSPRYSYRFPLLEWGWTREDCKRVILSDRALVAIAAELGIDPVPPKSSCFFCPASKPEEIRALVDAHPDYGDRILALERGAAPNLRTIEGLWRSRTRTRPGSMTEFLTGVPLPVLQTPPLPPGCPVESVLLRS